ncbi:MAG: zinc metallopeptidase [bacterium]|nr:zinc metallopeptidase [bacterium]
MRWRGGEESDNVEDRRGLKVPGGAKGVGIGVIVIALIAVLMGGDPSQLLGLLSGSGAGVSAGPDAGTSAPRGEDDEQTKFVKVVLNTTEEVWNDLFGKMGRTYQEPTLVLFEDMVQSACGRQASSVGPFYCPGDNQVYLDLVFFEDLSKKLGAPGDFAQAYVIAHEVGHHVQNLLGTSTEVHRARQRLSEAEANEMSVRLELQADFFAGLWAHHAHKKLNIIEDGDVEEALNAASQIGDDRLQRNARGHVTPDSFTHGTSAQRVRWFRKGLRSGNFQLGDTFSIDAEDL